MAAITATLGFADLLAAFVLARTLGTRGGSGFYIILQCMVALGVYAPYLIHQVNRTQFGERDMELQQLH